MLVLVGLLALAGIGALAASLYRGPCADLEGAAVDAAPVTRDVPAVLAEVGAAVVDVEAFAEALDLGRVRSATSFDQVAGPAPLAGADDGVFVLGGGTVRSVDTAQVAVAATQRSDPQLLEVPVRGGIAVADPDSGETMVLDGDLQQQSCGMISTLGVPLAADEAYAIVAGGDEVTLSPLRPGGGWTRAFPRLGLDGAAALPTRAILDGADAVVGLVPETGEQAWRFERDRVDVVEAGDDVTLVAAGSTLTALDTASGRQRWAADLGAPVRDAAGLGGRVLAVTDGAVVTVDDGEEVGRAATRLDLQRVAVSGAYTAWQVGGASPAAVVLIGPAGDADGG